MGMLVTAFHAFDGSDDQHLSQPHWLIKQVPLLCTSNARINRRRRQRRNHSS